MPPKKIAKTSDLAPGSGKVVEADGETIALFNVEGTLYAMGNTCPHRGGPLGEGSLEGNIVTCPWHGAQFNVETGEVLRPPAPTGVKSYPARVEGEDVLIEFD